MTNKPILMSKKAADAEKSKKPNNVLEFKVKAVRLHDITADDVGVEDFQTMRKSWQETYGAKSWGENPEIWLVELKS